MVVFKVTFCRLDVEIYFLGLFDCVDSVGKFESLMCSNSSPYVPKSPAKCTRLAVSIHERRGKSKAALFQFMEAEELGFYGPGKSKSNVGDNDGKPGKSELIEEWVAGNVADVGGG